MIKKKVRLIKETGQISKAGVYWTSRVIGDC